MQKRPEYKNSDMKVFKNIKIIFLSLIFSFSFIFCNYGEEQVLISDDQSDHLIWVRKQHALFNTKNTKSTYTIYSKKTAKKLFSENYTGDLQSLYLSGNLLYSVYPKSIQRFDLNSRIKKIIKRNESGFSFLGLVIQGNIHYHIAQKKDQLYTRSNDKPWRLLKAMPKISSKTTSLVFSHNNQCVIALKESKSEGSVHTITFKDDNLNLNSGKLNELSLSNISAHRGELILIMTNDGDALKLTHSNTSPYNLPNINIENAKILALASDKYSQHILYKDDDNFYTQIGNHSEPLSTPISSQKSSSRKAYFINQFAWTFFIIVSISMFISIRKKQQKLLNLKAPIPQTAHLLYRVLAFIIDIVILSPIVELINYTFFEDNLKILAQFVIQYENLQNNPEQLLEIINANIPLFIPLIITHQLIFVMYHVFFEIIFSASLGKMFFQLKLVSQNDSKITPNQIVIKNIFRLIDYFLTLPLGFIFCLSSKTRQSLGDRMAKTIVISQRS